MLAAYKREVVSRWASLFVGRHHVARGGMDWGGGMRNAQATKLRAEEHLGGKTTPLQVQRAILATVLLNGL
jgi:hypothetical protein